MGLGVRGQGWGGVSRLLSVTPFGLIVLGLGCTFGGYVPKGPPPAPLAESEVHMADLAIGQTVSGELDCPAGHCRVRYRIVAPSSGDLTVRIEGPGGQPGADGWVGPRIGRVVLEGVGQQTLATRTRSDGPPPFSLESAVQPGLHYVLVQGLGGSVDYQVSASFKPLALAVHEQGLEPGVDAETRTAPGQGDLSNGIPPPQRGRGPGTIATVDRTVVQLPRHAPGDLSDGADYVQDPTVEVVNMRRYAFAQDPKKLLESKPGTNVGDPFLLAQIQRDVRYVFANQGRELVPVDQAEFLVAIGVGVKSSSYWSLNVFGASSLDYDFNYGPYFNTWGTPGPNVVPITYEDGTVLIDLLSPKDGKLIWHGWAVKPVPISGNEDKPIRQSVDKILGQL